MADRDEKYGVRKVPVPPIRGIRGPTGPGVGFWVFGFRFSVFGFRFSVFGFRNEPTDSLAPAR